MTSYLRLGIGRKSLLESLGIPVLIDLPSVGENLQEHLFSGMQFKLKPGYDTYGALHFP